MTESRAEQYLRKSAEAGKLGDSEIVELIFDKTRGEDQFASQVVFVAVRLKHRNSAETEDVGLVVKMQTEHKVVRERMNTATQFYDELVTYEHILPFLELNNIASELFPRYCHAHYATDSPMEDFVIIHDLRQDGFSLSAQKPFLDFEHAVLSFKHLGRYHSLSYAAKQRDFNQLMGVVDKLKEPTFLDKFREGLNSYWGVCTERGIRHLSKRTEYKTVLEKVTTLIAKDPFSFMKSLVVPEEPMAVVCHGDFCRNNILYKYEDSKPIKVKFFDLATSRYCSPVIDISFFMFLNVPSAIRRERWDDLLAAYHEGLSSGVPGTKVPSLDDIQQEMRKKAAYAYVICSYFLPPMMSEERMELNDLMQSSQEQIIYLAFNYGGTVATEALGTVLEDLILKQCL